METKRKREAVGVGNEVARVRGCMYVYMCGMVARETPQP